MQDQDKATRAMQRFLREAIKPYGGRAIHGKEALAAYDAGRVRTLLISGNLSYLPKDVESFLFKPESTPGRILMGAFGGVAAILKRGA